MKRLLRFRNLTANPQLICKMLFLFLLSSTVYGQLSVHIDNAVIENLLPDTTIIATITIRNIDTKDADIQIYLSDYQINLNQTHYANPNTTPRSNAAWIKLGATDTTIPANTTKQIPVEIDIPNDDTLSGSYWSLIMVEPKPSNILIGDINQEEVSEQNLRIISRHGLNVITSFKEGYSDFEFEKPSMSYSKNETPIFNINSENIGTSIVKADVYLDIYASNGEEFGRIDIGKQVFRPRNPVSLTFDFSQLISENQLGLVADTYSALLIVDAGDDNLFGARYNLDIQ